MKQSMIVLAGRRRPMVKLSRVPCDGRISFKLAIPRVEISSGNIIDDEPVDHNGYKNDEGY